MATIQRRAKVASTLGSQRVSEFTERHNLHPMQLTLPVSVHQALTKLSDRLDPGRGSLQRMFTNACERKLLGERLPPLVTPPAPSSERAKKYTWYVPRELYQQLRILAAQMNSSVLQLVLSATVALYQKEPEIIALGLEVSNTPYQRAPVR